MSYIYTAAVSLNNGEDTDFVRGLVADAVTIAELRVLFTDGVLYLTGTQQQLDDFAFGTLGATETTYAMGPLISAPLRPGQTSTHPPLRGGGITWGGYCWLTY